MDAIDTAAPWTIKSCPTATRLAVIEASRKEGLTVGQWLERRVREWTADGSPVQIQAAPGADLGSLVSMAVALAEVPAERSDDPVIRTARARVKAELVAMQKRATALRPQPPRLAPPPAALEPPAPPAKASRGTQLRTNDSKILSSVEPAARKRSRRSGSSAGA